MSEAAGMVDFLEEMPDYSTDLYTHKKMKTNPEVALNALKWVLPILESITDFTEQSIHDTLNPAIAESGMKNGQVLWPLRIAISGKASTPGGAVGDPLTSWARMKRLVALRRLLRSWDNEEGNVFFLFSRKERNQRKADWALSHVKLS